MMDWFYLGINCAIIICAILAIKSQKHTMNNIERHKKHLEKMLSDLENHV